MLDATGPFRYAVQQSTFTITNINMLTLPRTDDIRIQLYNVCEVLIRAIQEGIEKDIIVRNVEKINVIGRNVNEALCNIEFEDTIYTNVIKAIMNKEIA